MLILTFLIFQATTMELKFLFLGYTVHPLNVKQTYIFATKISLANLDLGLLTYFFFKLHLSNLKPIFCCRIEYMYCYMLTLTLTYLLTLLSVLSNYNFQGNLLNLKAMYIWLPESNISTCGHNDCTSPPTLTPLKKSSLRFLRLRLFCVKCDHKGL